MSCPLKDSCLKCKVTDYLTCSIVINWFLAQQESSVRTHASKLVEDDISIRRIRR